MSQAPDPNEDKLERRKSSRIKPPVNYKEADLRWKIFQNTAENPQLPKVETEKTSTSDTASGSENPKDEKLSIEKINFWQSDNDEYTTDEEYLTGNDTFNTTGDPEITFDSDKSQTNDST